MKSRRAKTLLSKNGATLRGTPLTYFEPTEPVADANWEVASILKGITRGERAIEAGHFVTHAVAKQRMARWLK